jgi:class 3 adenylate cyclase
MHEAHLLTPGERLSARWLHRRLITIYVVAAAMAVAIGTVLYLFGLDLAPHEIPIMAGISALACVPMLLSDVLVINIHFRPIGAFLRALPGRAAVTDAAAALVRALNLPVLSALRVMLVHVPSFVVPLTLLALLADLYLDLAFLMSRMVIAWLTAVFAATGHAISEYFAVTVTIRPVVRLIWSHCGELTPEQRRRIIPVGLRRKLFFVSAFVVFIPLLVLGFTVLVKVDALLVGLGIGDIALLTAPLRTWVVLLVGGSTVAMLFMSVAMARETTYSVGEMMRAFRRVEGEELDVRLTVTSTDEFAVLYKGFNRMTNGLQERERLRHAFGCYVAPELAEEVMRHGVSLGGEAVRASVLFADIRDFTALAEKMAPTEVVSLLNRYFATVGSAIKAEGGWINKFGGDSLLAVFGAPAPQADHARRAVRAAQGMRTALAEFNVQQQQESEPTVRIGIGIDCGDMVAGSVGSPERMEYTVIGDVVNVASRIDGLNKKWGTDVLISAEALAASGVDVPTRAMPLAEVKGKSEPIQVYALE